MMLAKTIGRKSAGSGRIKVNGEKTGALHTFITAGNGVTIRVGKRCT